MVYSVCSLITILSVISPLLASDCESGWVRGPSQSTSCYKFVSSPPANWSGAIQICRNLGGYLTTLETIDEIAWMKGYRSYFSEDLGATTWIGGFQENGAGPWLWHGHTTHSPILLSDWAPYQPDDYAGRQHCLALFGVIADNVEASFGFDDSACTNVRSFICEKMIWLTVCLAIPFIEWFSSIFSHIWTSSVVYL